MAIFAGLAPLYVSTLTHYFNDIMIPAKVLTIAYAVQIIAILIDCYYFWKKTKSIYRKLSLSNHYYLKLNKLTYTTLKNG
jgi:hypothetical protein